MYLPMPQREEPREELEPLFQWARDAGMETIDLSQMWRGQDVAALQVAPWDRHPNREGHQLIAERVYEVLSAPGMLELRQPVSTQAGEDTSLERSGARPATEGM
jgi:hypothetical protein